MNESYVTGLKNGDMALAEMGIAEVANFNTLTIVMLFATTITIIVTLLFCKLIQKRKMSSVGFVKKVFFKEYLLGLLVGFIIFLAAVLLCVVTGSLELTGLSSTFSVGIFLLFGLGYMIQGLSEEVLCRGYMMISIARRYPLWLAVLLNSCSEL